MSEDEQERFKEAVWDYYAHHGREHLPWRRTTDPYHIMVAEIMLQQTQVERVIPKYEAFIARFPTVRSLARAQLRDVLALWHGLGYNRRAKYLKRAAETITKEYKGRFPDTLHKLTTLPGVGTNTAGAIMAYAFNTGVPYLETNIKTVYIYHFFEDKDAVTDTEIRELVAQTLDHENPREWYAALMDYGTHLKKTHGNLSRQSKTYQRQSPFKGSRREKRAQILRLVTDKPHSLREIEQKTHIHKELLKDITHDLTREGLIQKNKQMYTIA